MSNEDKIMKEINNHIITYGGGYSKWYVGVSSDAKNRLAQHGVTAIDKWVYHTARSHRSASSIKQFFIARGADGFNNTSDNSAQMVYAYKKSINTHP